LLISTGSKPINRARNCDAKPAAQAKLTAAKARPNIFHSADAGAYRLEGKLEYDIDVQ
jgi:hypothetical protein